MTTQLKYTHPSRTVDDLRWNALTLINEIADQISALPDNDDDALLLGEELFKALRKVGEAYQIFYRVSK